MNLRPLDPPLRSRRPRLMVTINVKGGVVKCCNNWANTRLTSADRTVCATKTALSAILYQRLGESNSGPSTKRPKVEMGVVAARDSSADSLLNAQLRELHVAKEPVVAGQCSFLAHETDHNPCELYPICLLLGMPDKVPSNASKLSEFRRLPDCVA